MLLIIYVILKNHSIDIKAYEKEKIQCIEKK